MCLAIPGRVEEITTDGVIRLGRVNFGGVVKRVCLDYVPQIEVGDYAIVHVGFAISQIDEKTAQETLDTFRAMGVLEEELASEEEVLARAAVTEPSPCPDGSCSVSPVSESRPFDKLRTGSGAPGSARDDGNAESGV
jgi:hydrogenase expression/formation protein HypC